MNLKTIILFVTAVFLGSMCEQQISRTPPEEKLKFINILIDSNPEGAQIFVDGLSSNYFTPDSVPFFYDKEYFIELKKENYRDTSVFVSPFHLADNKIYIDYLQNPKMYGRIFCFTIPDGAEVLFNDSLTSIRTPDTLFHIIPGEYIISFRLSEYLPDSVSVIVKSNLTSDAVRFLKKP